MRYLLLASFFLGIAACSVSKVSDRQDYQYDLISEMTLEPTLLSKKLHPFMVVNGKMFEFIESHHRVLDTVFGVAENDITIGELRFKKGERAPIDFILRKSEDSILVKVTDLTANKYVLLNKFSIDAKALRQGNYDTSSLGINFSKSFSNSNADVKEVYGRDTLLDGMWFKYNTSVSFNKEIKDSFVTTTFIAVDTTLFTPFSVIKCHDCKIHIAGVDSRTKDGKWIFGQRVGNLRKLDAKDGEVCKAILKKIGW